MAVDDGASGSGAAGGASGQRRAASYRAGSVAFSGAGAGAGGLPLAPGSSRFDPQAVDALDALARIAPLA